MTDTHLFILLADADPEKREAMLRAMDGMQREETKWHWNVWARQQQLPPEGDWRTWLIMAGRGFGKTRAGSEWVRSIVETDPDARIALIGASFGETRAVMVEGESGLLAISPPERMPSFESSLRRIVWPNGAQATLYSALEPEALRGPQHSHAWCDEIAKWDNANGKAIVAVAGVAVINVIGKAMENGADTEVGSVLLAPSVLPIAPT
jgi:phage terminase large subunit-like protein